MKVVREVMTAGARCVTVDQSVADAARMMGELRVGVLPVCEGEAVTGVIIDRDLVVGVLASGRDADACRSGDLARTGVAVVDADDPTDEVLTMMVQHRLRRLPVVDDARLVGVITLGDIARELPQHRVGEVVEALAVS